MRRYSGVQFPSNPPTHRGYCYVRYCNVEEAREAVRSLNNYQIRPGWRLAVTRSVDNQKLCLKTIPPISPDTKEQEVVEELHKILDGVLSVRFLNRVWLEVKFESHRQAALARRKVVPGTLSIFQRVNIREVDWADPDIETQPRERNRTVLVKGFSEPSPEQRILKMFNTLSGGSG